MRDFYIRNAEYLVKSMNSVFKMMNSVLRMMNSEGLRGSLGALGPMVSTV